jgi:integrase
MQAYQAALDGVGPAHGRNRGAPGTFDRLVQEYFESSSYARLSSSSKRPYRLVIERWVTEEGIGHRLVAQMTRQHVDRMLARRQATPGAANDLLKKVRILMRFAIGNNWRSDDPTLGIKRFKAGTFHTWTDDEICGFEDHWPVGTRERLAFALLLYTGQRRSDVVRMSWGDIEADCIRVVQQKTKTKLVIPLHPDLAEMLAQWPKTHVVILPTRQGRPFTPAGFGGWMAEKIAAAGLPDHCVTHGLRKAAARRLADAGCTTLQIMSVTGHKSLQEVERYTRETAQQRSAVVAIRKLGRRSGNTESQKP